MQERLNQKEEAPPPAKEIEKQGIGDPAYK
jgi:hypothetical protein